MNIAPNPVTALVRRREYILILQKIYFCGSSIVCRAFYWVLVVDGDTRNDILIDLPYYLPEESDDGIDVSKVALEIVFDEEINVLSDIPDVVDLRDPFIIKIKNADGAEEDVNIIADIKKSNRAQMLSFALPSVGLNGTIVESVRMIGVDRGSLDLSNLVPEITISSGATIAPDPNEPAKFVKLWEDLSDELKDYPNSLVAYELLNEPVSADAENWNRVSALAIDAIRAREADRTIVVGVCTSNGSVRYNELTLPSSDQILLTYHFYAPYLLTAYGLQSTTGGRTDIPIQYPGQLVPNEWIDQLPANWQETGRRHYDRSRLEESLLSGIDMARRLNAPVFVGEFGTMNTTPEPSRANWYRDVVYIMNKYDVPYTSFDYKGAGYSVVNENRSLRYPDLIDILTGK